MSNSRYKSRKFWLIAALLWMVLIFSFSHQKAEESGEVSGTLSYRIAEGINTVFSLDWDEETLLQYAKEWEHPVRKAAHMTEYGILACILLGNCMQYPLLQKRGYIRAGLGAVLYAATDEFHQLFIEGRSGEVKDVCIDSIGAVIGLLLAWGVLSAWKRIYFHKGQKQV